MCFSPLNRERLTLQLVPTTATDLIRAAFPVCPAPEGSRNLPTSPLGSPIDSTPSSLSTSPTQNRSPAGGSSTSLPHQRHRRSGSGPLIFSDGSHSQSTNNNNSASSPAANVLPAGNICPSGKLGKSALIPRTSPLADVLGSGTGHGSIMRRSKPVGERRGVSAAEEVARAGNGQYKQGQLVEALRLYEKAVAMCPGHTACRNNRAAALMGLAGGWWRL